ncbi:MAG TPA: VWA domain-containing protein [Terriglobales bacterium]|nr:VWA domain-containing protein [Terriglobales bacterium]
MRLVVPVLLATFVAAGQQTPSPSTQAQSTSQNGTTAGRSSTMTPATATEQSQSAAPTAPNNPSTSSQSSSAPNSTSQQTQSANPPVLKVTTRLVLVDVVVTDGYGRPVTDLKQADFAVKENGKPQKIVAFAFQPPPPPPVPGKPAYKPFTLAPGVFTNLRNLNGEVGPPTILLIDGLNTPFKDQPYMRQQLVKYLEHLEPGRNVAIYTLGRRLRMIQDFTSDPDLLHEALKKITLQSSMFNQDQQDLSDEFPGLDPDSSDQSIAQMAQQMQEFESEQQAYQRDLQVRITLDAMKELAHNIAGYPGRKNLVWLSGSFPLTIFPDETSSNPFNVARQYGDDLRNTATVFANEQIAVYPVDARGLVGSFMPDASQSGASLAGPRGGMRGMQQMQRASAQLAASHDAMNELASQTGGRAFYNRNDIDRAIGLSVAEGSTYYTLAYYPEDKGNDGKFRKIEVKLDRKGLQSRYRKGYFATDTQPPDEKTARNDFLRSLAPDAPTSTALPFLVRVTPPDKEHKELSLDFSVVPQAINFEPQNGLEHAEIEFLTRIYDLKGKPVGSTNADLISTQLKPETYKQIMTHGLRYRQTVSLPPGKYVLKMGVRDHRSNAIGTLVAKVEVPQA